MVGDHVSCNREAFAILRSKYPKLFPIGCIAQCFNLFMKDICLIAEVEELIIYTRNITTFVKTHKYVQAELKTIIRQSGLVLKRFHSARFSYADFMSVRCSKKKQNLENMVGDGNRLNIKQGITETSVVKFEKGVSEMPVRKINALHEIVRRTTKSYSLHCNRHDSSHMNISVDTRCIAACR